MVLTELHARVDDGAITDDTMVRVPALACAPRLPPSPLHRALILISTVFVLALSLPVVAHPLLPASLEDGALLRLTGLGRGR